MRISTLKGMAAGGIMGATLGAGLMMTSKGKRLKRAMEKSGHQLKRQLTDVWGG